MIFSHSAVIDVDAFWGNTVRINGVELGKAAAAAVATAAVCYCCCRVEGCDGILTAIEARLAMMMNAMVDIVDTIVVIEMMIAVVNSVW